VHFADLLKTFPQKTFMHLGNWVKYVASATELPFFAGDD
jgi:hypothetical protein